ncbi:MAG TPA: type II toxin-antitoxin system RelE/ParE family toxin [Caulobacteraceae bacterium]
MAQIVWTRGAVLELLAIRAYVAQFSPLAAQRLAARLRSAANSLESSPDRGRPISRGRRELAVIHPYLIRYVREGERVIVLEIRHTAREPD